ncbi:hypothetical protein NL108_016740 [Boleophthalmus pectinirostris]|nr:hypothetical protein NL108_016740 [Boleophthalmus pectinirostris]
MIWVFPVTYTPSLVCQYLLFLLYHCHLALLRMSPAERASVLLQVVKYSAENGHRAAERKFGVSEKLVRDWRKAGMESTASRQTGQTTMRLSWKCEESLSRPGRIHGEETKVDWTKVSLVEDVSQVNQAAKRLQLLELKKQLG